MIPMANDIFFFFGHEKILVTQASLTGAQIKAAIKEKVPSFDLSHELILEGSGNEPDEPIGDEQSVFLVHGHGEGPKHFFSRPPTNFG
jgi:hypothetical protein